MRGVRVAYYLVHSLGAGSGFPERDVTAARNFGAAAKKAGVERIIYLGGLGDPGKALSAHLRSRHETATPCGKAGTGHRISGWGHCRFGESLLRNDPLSHRAGASDDLPALGLHPNTTHRRPNRARLSQSRRFAFRPAPDGRSRSAVRTLSLMAKCSLFTPKSAGFGAGSCRCQFLPPSSPRTGFTS